VSLEHVDSGPATRHSLLFLSLPSLPLQLARSREARPTGCLAAVDPAVATPHVFCESLPFFKQ
ncbi:MAG: hypothetical protein WCO92_00615, partial [Verrucomicrobiota bacterium]